MKRTSSWNLHGRAAAVFIASSALAVGLALFTSDGALADKSKGSKPVRNVGLASIQYSDTQFAVQVPYVSTEPQDTDYPASLVRATLVGLNFDPPVAESDWITLPDPGTAPVVDTVPQRVRAELLLGPGSEPFAIDAFFDITYRVSNVSSSEFGPYNVELLAMSLVGDHPSLGSIKLQNNPSLASVGFHTITPLPDGAHLQFESFFDVFTEISIGDGPFAPGDEEFRVGYVPEPGTIVLALFSILGFGLRRRRRF